VRTVDTAALIARYIEPNPDRPGVDDARLVAYGVPVWALIGHYDAIGRDAAVVARGYRVRLEAVQAALAYYERHKAVIDARIAANAP
jgi:uncharacterized protein (DUF433 family)